MAAAAIVGGLIGMFLFGMPLQLSDMLANLLIVQKHSWPEILRPLLYLEPRAGSWVVIKFFFDIAHGHYFVTFKTLHVFMVLLCLLLAVRLMNVKTPVDFASAIVAIYMIVGMHTFRGLISEGFPINDHLIAVLAGVVSANLAYSKNSYLVDFFAILCFMATVQIIETGVLIPVILLTTYMLGWRGVSLGALAVIVLLLCFYLVSRSSYLENSGSIINNSTGFGLYIREPSDILIMFSGKMYIFFLYNVACAILSVVLSEPQGGTWVFLKALLNKELLPYQIAEVGSSILLAILMTLYAFRRAPYWFARTLNHSDRLFLLAFPILIANAALSFAYLKNDTLGTAGLFWSLAGFAAIREFLEFAANFRTKPIGALAVVIVVALVSFGFGVRTMSAHVQMYINALHTQSDWIEDLISQPGYQSESPEGRALVEQLQAEALMKPVPPKALLPRWLLRYEPR